MTYYPYSYNDFIYGFSGPELEQFERYMEEFMLLFMQIGLVVGVIGVILYLVFYVFTSLSIYTMADRRGFSGAFLAWIPLVRWGMLGRVASDIHQERTGSRAFYGTAMTVFALIPAASTLCVLLSDSLAWVTIPAAFLHFVSGIVTLFALSEIYRDYSRHWVGMLIFAALMPFLQPIFLLSIHKNIPASVMARRASPASQAASACAPIVTPPPAPAAKEPIVTPPPAQNAEAPHEEASAPPKEQEDPPAEE